MITINLSYKIPLVKLTANKAKNVPKKRRGFEELDPAQWKLLNILCSVEKDFESFKHFVDFWGDSRLLFEVGKLPSTRFCNFLSN